MLKVIKRDSLGHSNLGWLDSFHHFSFSSYYNPDNINFGVLRVLNDDMVAPVTGFDTHPHRDMEIISYVVEGELAHADNMNNRRVLKRGQVQYLSAGTGITHSEHNYGHEVLRFLQIWIVPDKNGHEPQYGDYLFDFEERVNKWLPIATGNEAEDFPIHINADANIYATYLTPGETIDFPVCSSRQVYLVAIEGEMKVNDVLIGERDAVEIIGEDITIYAGNSSHVLIIEMAKEE